MLTWLFKSRPGADAPQVQTALRPATPKKAAQVASAQVTPAAQAEAKAEAKAEHKARQSEDARAQWAPRLQAALGDNAALLQLALDTPVLELKLAAVQALQGEEILKQAERAFRSHDRKVHRIAKQRFEALVAQRESRARAQSLIESAQAMTELALVPVNHLVALDQDWQALEPSRLEPSQLSLFTELRARLDAALRAQVERQQAQQRWNADAARALADLRLACQHAATDGADEALTACCAHAGQVRAGRPDDPSCAAADAALEAALQNATALQARLAWLDALEGGETLSPTADALSHDDTGAPVLDMPIEGMPVEGMPTQDMPDQGMSADMPAPPSAPSPYERWKALPAVGDRALSELLERRFERWQQSQAQARAAAEALRAKPAKPAKPAKVRKVADPELLQRLDAALQAAETALAEGHLGLLPQQLQSIDAAFDALQGVPAGQARTARRHAVQAEFGRLKGWQQWGGGRAREALVDEAEALAKATQAAADPEAKAPKLRLKAHGDAIHALRVRWKELDRLGGAASQPLWQRFDAALQIAHQPVAAQHAALQAARQDNLAQREALLAALDAVALDQSSMAGDDAGSPWKEPLRALDRFHTAWRQLGPLEHTVPQAARNALQQRLRDSVDRIESPLKEARRAAEAERVRLIERAEALARELGPSSSMRELAPRVRELQAQWQQQARALPLTRSVEGALWARFRAATDAVFAQREAALQARDAELAAQAQAADALIGRLTALRGDEPAAEIERTLAEVDRAWRSGGELPRGAAPALEARYREACATARQHLAMGGQRRWQAECDTLAAKLALCDERAAGGGDEADQAQRWAALGRLPSAWDAALALRWSKPAATGPLSAAEWDEALLRLEAALDLPATPEREAARRALKLRALKEAMEGHRATHAAPRHPADWFAAVLRQAPAGPAQRERLQALLAAMRQASPGTFVAPPPARR